MNEFSVPMALVDYLPVIFFAIASVILLRDLYNKMSKGAFALFSAGVIDVTLAGALRGPGNCCTRRELAILRLSTPCFSPCNPSAFCWQA